MRKGGLTWSQPKPPTDEAEPTELVSTLDPTAGWIAAGAVALAAVLFRPVRLLLGTGLLAFGGLVLTNLASQYKEEDVKFVSGNPNVSS